TIADGDRVRVTSRRGTLDLFAQVVATIRPDTVFIPYHWPGSESANLLTVRAYDPVAKIPEFKVCAVRVERIAPGEAAAGSSASSSPTPPGASDAGPASTRAASAPATAARA